MCNSGDLFGVNKQFPVKLKHYSVRASLLARTMSSIAVVTPSTGY
jgi:hypothetical protein